VVVCTCKERVYVNQLFLILVTLTINPEGRGLEEAKVITINCPFWKQATVTELAFVEHMNPETMVRAEGKVMMTLSPL
jgi:hypothetical protein